MPAADRPAIPSSYGIEPISKGRLLDWGTAEARLAAARNYWVATASPRGTPHASPVWGIWHQGAFYFGTDPRSRKGRDLVVNPIAVVHLESGDDVVILEGTVSGLRPDEVSSELDAAYADKYGFPLKGNHVFRLVPRRAFGWAEADFPKSATRWTF